MDADPGFLSNLVRSVDLRAELVSAVVPFWPQRTPGARRDPSHKPKLSATPPLVDDVQRRKGGWTQHAGAINTFDFAFERAG